jgi:hypothetical protein
VALSHIIDVGIDTSIRSIDCGTSSMPLRIHSAATNPAAYSLNHHQAGRPSSPFYMCMYVYGMVDGGIIVCVVHLSLVRRMDGYQMVDSEYERVDREESLS